MSLLEARSNPDKNRRKSIFKELLKYQGQKDVFVSFTGDFNNRSKIGINPKSSYNTPFGIYCYPVDYVIKYTLTRFSDDEKEITAPFTGNDDWKFLYVLRAKNGGIVSTNQDALPYYNKLKKIVIASDYENLIKMATHTAKTKDTRTFLWKLSKDYADALKRTEAPAMWNAVLRRLGINLFVDFNDQGLIHPNEPTQAVFTSISSFSVVDVLTRRDVSFDDDNISKAIINGTFDYELLSPSLIASLLTQLRSINYEKELIDNIRKNIDPLMNSFLNKTILNNITKIDELELLKGQKNFTLDKNNFAVFDSNHSKPNLIFVSSIEKYIGRRLLPIEWYEYLYDFLAPKIKEFIDELTPENADFVNKKFIDILIKLAKNNAHVDYTDSIESLCERFDIPLTNQLKRQLYILNQNTGITTNDNDWFKIFMNKNEQSSTEVIREFVQNVPYAKLEMLLNSLYSTKLSKTGIYGALEILDRLIEHNDIKPVIKYLMKSNIRFDEGMIGDGYMDHLENFMNMHFSQLVRKNVTILRRILFPVELTTDEVSKLLAPTGWGFPTSILNYLIVSGTINPKNIGDNIYQSQFLSFLIRYITYHHTENEKLYDELFNSADENKIVRALITMQYDIPQGIAWWEYIIEKWGKTIIDNYPEIVAEHLSEFMKYLSDPTPLFKFLENNPHELYSNDVIGITSQFNKTDYVKFYVDMHHKGIFDLRKLDLSDANPMALVSKMIKADPNIILKIYTDPKLNHYVLDERVRYLTYEKIPLSTFELLKPYSLSANLIEELITTFGVETLGQFIVTEKSAQQLIDNLRFIGYTNFKLSVTKVVKNILPEPIRQEFQLDALKNITASNKEIIKELLKRTIDPTPEFIKAANEKLKK